MSRNTTLPWNICSIDSLCISFEYERMTGEEGGNILYCLLQYDKTGYKEGSIANDPVFEKLSDFEKGRLEALRIDCERVCYIRDNK